MNNSSKGIHHITIISGDGQRNALFYVHILGLKMVMKSVNQDDPTTYHLFYANGSGEPGSSITFFPSPMAIQGIPGSGSSVAVAFAVPSGSAKYWNERLSKNDIPFDGPFPRFDHQVIRFQDPDGLQLEFVFDPSVNMLPAWQESKVPEQFGIRGFWSTTLRLNDGISTADILENILGFEKKQDTENLSLYRTSSRIGNSVIIEKNARPEPGRNGRGVVHHVAFRAKDEEEQLEMRLKLINRGLYPTEVIDRFVFKSVYFRVPDGVLFEIATDGPGYASTMPEEEMGKKLFLPQWLEPSRKIIEKGLPEIKI